MIRIFPMNFDSDCNYQLNKVKKVQPVSQVNKDCADKKNFYQQSHSDSSTFQQVLEEKLEKYKRNN